MSVRRSQRGKLPEPVEEEFVEETADEFITSEHATEDDDEAPDAISFSGSRQQAERALQDLNEHQDRRQQARKRKTALHQEQNRQQKLDKQRRIEDQLAEELLEELRQEEQEEQQQQEEDQKPKKNVGRISVERKRATKKFVADQHQFATLDYVPLSGGGGTRFRSAALFDGDISTPVVVNPKLSGLKDRLLHSARIKRVSSKQLKRIRAKQLISGKYGPCT